jgi:hypothetical protein
LFAQHTSFLRENLEFVVCFSSIYRLVLKENLRRKQIEGMFLKRKSKTMKLMMAVCDVVDDPSLMNHGLYP